MRSRRHTGASYLEIHWSRRENEVMKFVERQRNSADHIGLAHRGPRRMHEKCQIDRLRGSHKKTNAAATARANDRDILSGALQFLRTQSDFLSQLHIALHGDTRSNEIKCSGTTSSCGDGGRIPCDRTRRRAQVRILRVGHRAGNAQTKSQRA